MKERFALGPYQASVGRLLDRAKHQMWTQRIWAKDAALWKVDPDHQRIISNSLGWLRVASDLRPLADEIMTFAGRVSSRGMNTACLLGMGGSSLCPEVCAETFGSGSGFLKLMVLDSTDPAGLLSAERQMDLGRTLFIVASKSGGTIESIALFKYFYHRMTSLRGDDAGRNFIAITDAGTSLEKIARDRGFLEIFTNPGDIGGRYSALSLFGLVPMALIGLDVAAVLDRAISMAGRCADAEPARNPGLLLGAALGGLALEGRDKLTFVFAPEIRTLGWWVEQLIAESTGKEGKGILPVDGEPLAGPELYAQDRIFLYVNLAGSCNAETEKGLADLEAAGQPVIRWTLDDALDLGGEFFRWEFATAVAGAALEINPFDQPNVQESKDITQELIGKFCTAGSLPRQDAVLTEGSLAFYASPAAAGALERTRSAGAALESFLGLMRPEEYAALLAYVERSPDHSLLLEKLRLKIRSRLRRATTTGFGPRFLHSTGQLHKGGPDNGVFMQITGDDARDVGIPGEPYSFGVLKRAQALGDFKALAIHGRRALRIHVHGPITDGLEHLARLL